MNDAESRFSRIALIVLILAGVAGAGMAFRQMYGELRGIASPPALPVIAELPEFELTRETGATVSLDDLAGKAWIADFIFTRCAGPCPIMMQRMTELQSELEGSDIGLVTISVDPEYDTPKVLSDYARKFGADPDRWMFLTGDRTEIYDLSIKGFKLAVDRDVDYERQIIHSTRFVVVDRRGRIRAYHDGVDGWDLDALVADARASAAE